MTGDYSEHLPFVVDVFGVFAPGRVRVAYDGRPRPTTPALEALIADAWERQRAVAAREGKLLFNGALLRYVDHATRRAADGGGATFWLTVGPTCYRDFVGTNLYNHHRLAELGWERFANPVGTTATLTTADGRICYGRRSQRVSYHAGHVHTFGGALEVSDRQSDGTIDPFASVCRELAEELAVEAAELTDLRCVGLIRDKEIHQPEMLFEARVGLSYGELAARWRAAETADEHEGLVQLADRPEAVVPFLVGCGPIAPVAVGALYLQGLAAWGEAWWREAADALPGRLRATEGMSGR